MRGSFWAQLAMTIVVVFAAIRIRSSTGQDPTPSTTPVPEPRQTFDIDFIFVMHLGGQPATWNKEQNIPTVYKEVMVDEFRKWYMISEGKSRVAIIGQKEIASNQYAYATLLEWSTDLAEWETRLTTMDNIYPDEATIDGALKLVQDLVLSGRDSGRPTVVLFSSFTFGHSVEIVRYGFDQAVLANSLKADGILLLVALEVTEAEIDEARTAKMGKMFGTEFVYLVPLNIWKDKFKGLPAWIESRVTSTFCNETNDGDTCFFKTPSECMKGKYYKDPSTVDICDVSSEPCANTTCDETCDRMWPWDVPCTNGTCEDKAPKRLGQMKWNKLAHCPISKMCEECAVTSTFHSTTVSTIPSTVPLGTVLSTLPSTLPSNVSITTPPTPGTSGGGNIDGSVVAQQLIIALLISTRSIICG